MSYHQDSAVARLAFSAGRTEPGTPISPHPHDVLVAELDRLVDAGGLTAAARCRLGVSRPRSRWRAWPGHDLRFLCRRVFGHWGRARAERKADRECASVTLVAVHRDGAVVCFHDGLGVGQSQAGALDRLLGGGRGAEEAFEDPLPVVFADADAGVGDGELSLFFHGSEPDLDLPAGRGELHGIGEEVAK